MPTEPITAEELDDCPWFDAGPALAGFCKLFNCQYICHWPGKYEAQVRLCCPAYKTLRELEGRVLLEGWSLAALKAAIPSGYVPAGIVSDVATPYINVTLRCVSTAEETRDAPNP